MTSVPFAIMELLKEKINATGQFDKVGYFPDDYSNYSPSKYCLIAEGGTLNSESRAGNQYLFDKDFNIYIYRKHPKDRLERTIDLVSYVQTAIVDTFRAQPQIESIVNVSEDVGGINFDPMNYITAGTNKEMTLKIITVTYKYIDCVGSNPT